MTRWLALGLLTLLIPRSASAFCGFYVASADAPLHNRATNVVLLREGTLTVVAMENDYAGPAEDFAMVVPVPVVLHERDVRTLPREVFDRIDALGAPRLVEYWEQDPCGIPEGTIGLGGLGTIGHGSGYGSGGGVGRAAAVRVEAEFAVGEYDIVILGADEATALEDWLVAHHYHMPPNAAEALRPYVEEGMKFFVARVDVDRVHFVDGAAVLSPLRFHYHTDAFSLPVRLGLLNSAGVQDLVVSILGRHNRFEVANYENVFIPTNLDVADATRAHFGEFYATLFDATIERHPGAVVTEYAWGTSSCDPCPPEGSLTAPDLATLGADVAFPGGVTEFRSGSIPGVRIDPVEVEGMSRETVRRILRRHMNETRYCFEQAMVNEGITTARPRLHIEIAETGYVSAVRLEGATAPGFDHCLSSAGRRWIFPAPEGGSASVDVDYAFDDGGEEASTTPSEWVLTRLHYRYGASALGQDLVFRRAEGVIGGRELRDETGLLEPTAPAPMNNFQARYAIRHPFEGAITCVAPVRGFWGGPPSGAAPPTGVATDLGAVARGGLGLGTFLESPVPALDFVPEEPLAPLADLTPPLPPPSPAAPPVPPRSGCACGRETGPIFGAGWVLFAAAFLFARIRR